MGVALTETFEGLSLADLNGQNSWSGSGDFDVLSTPVQAGTRSVGHQSASATSITKSVSAQTVGTQSFYHRKDVATSGSGDVRFRRGSTVLFAIGTAASTSARLDANTSATIGTMADDTYYRIEVEWNVGLGTNGQVRARFNGGAWSSWLEAKASIGAGVDTIELFGSDTGSNPIYWDTFGAMNDANFIVTEDPLGIALTQEDHVFGAGQSLTVDVQSLELSINNPTLNANDVGVVNKTKNSATFINKPKS